MMRLLGAVLAGGEARRFGSDKALALLGGRTLIDHVVAALAKQCGGIVICGRDHAGLASVPDRPRAGLGPLGGINAALHWARDAGFEAVLTAPCDTPHLPDDFAERLSRSGGPAFVADLPVIGLWPVALAHALDAHLATGAERSLRGWARVAGATPVDIPGIANINTPAEWHAARVRHGC